MNERIQELLEEAGVEVWYDDDSGQTVFSGDNVKQLEKFAELIVRECANVADTDSLPKGVGCGYITYTTGERIKKHFGVNDERKN